MAFALGTNTFLGVANQADWGTPVEPETYIDFLLAGESLTKNREYKFTPRLDGTSQRKQPWLAKEWVQGSLPMLLNYSGIEWFFHQLLGTGITPAGPTDTTAYTWTLTPATTLPNGLSLHMNRDVKLFKYTDCMLSGAKIEFASGEPGKVTFDVIGKTPTEDTVEDRATKAASPGFSTYVPVLHNYGSVELASQEIKTYLKAASIDIVNPVSEEASIAATTIIQPQFTDKQAVSGTITGWVDATSYPYINQKFDDGTDVKIELHYLSSVLAGASSVYHSLKITLDSCYLTGAADPQSGSAGLIECTWPFEAWYDGTNAQISLEIVNKNSALA